MIVPVLTLSFNPEINRLNLENNEQDEHEGQDKHEGQDYPKRGNN